MEVTNKQLKQSLEYRKAKARVKNLKIYYFMLFGYVVIFLVYLINRNGEPFFILGPFLNGWLLTLWGVFLVLFGLFLYIPFFRHWEDRQLEKELKRFQQYSNRNKREL